MSQSRLLVVSGFANRRFEPRGIRTRAFVDALTNTWSVEVIAAPDAPTAHPGLAARAARYANHRFKEAFALDSYEPWSLRRFRHWHPSADLALLIGYPFSPVVLSARQLTRLDIPYIVDTSDPWAITSLPPSKPSLGRWRRLRAERELWNAAVAAIVTTPRQADALNREFPHLQILVRPNGYMPLADGLAGNLKQHQGNRSRLEIGHFGNLYRPRLDIAPFFDCLLRSRHWQEIVFHQYGQDFDKTLTRLPSGIRIESHQPVSWEEVLERSLSLDVALVVGNVDPSQLPSKVVQYLTLPIPRIAVLGDLQDDSIVDYIDDKPGWLTVTPSDPFLADKVMSHVSRSWAATELAPSLSESWEQVATQAREFVDQVGSPMQQNTIPTTSQFGT